MQNTESGRYQTPNPATAAAPEEPQIVWNGRKSRAGLYLTTRTDDEVAGTLLDLEDLAAGAKDPPENEVPIPARLPGRPRDHLPPEVRIRPDIKILGPKALVPRRQAQTGRGRVRQDDADPAAERKRGNGQGAPSGANGRAVSESRRMAAGANGNRRRRVSRSQTRAIGYAISNGADPRQVARLWGLTTSDVIRIASEAEQENANSNGRHAASAAG